MKISLITVCYNSANTIRTAFESVLRQKNVDLEYLVIDGASRDGTIEIIKEFEPSFSGRMVWSSEKDSGMYDAINKGISRATGDVVGILNADDFFETDFILADVVKAFSDADAPDAIYGDIRFISSGNSDADLDELRERRTLRYYSAKRWKAWMLQWGFMPPHPSVYIKKDFFAKLGVYKLDYQIAADYELLVRFLRKAKLRLKYLNKCMVGMRMGGKSTRNWRSNLTLNREIVRGNVINGYFCCLPMLVPKYAFKIWEFLLPEFSKNRSGK